MLLERHVKRSGFINKGFRTLPKFRDSDWVFKRHKQVADALKHLFIERFSLDSFRDFKTDPVYDLWFLEDNL